MILENSIRQFAKIISVKNGVYALSGWMTRENAEKATVAMKHVNVFGLQYAGVRVASAGTSSKKSAKSEPSDETGSSTSAAPAKPAAAKTAKGAAKKAGKTSSSAKKSGKGKK